MSGLKGEASAEVPKLLYVAEFPPSSEGASGSLNLYRLLADYPAPAIRLLTSYRPEPAEPFGPERYRLFKLLRGRGPLQAIAQLVNLVRLMITTLRLVHRERPRVILTVAHGVFPLAAAQCARVYGLPLAVIVHDEWGAELGGECLLELTHARAHRQLAAEDGLYATDDLLVVVAGVDQGKCRLRGPVQGVTP
jgi:hypothetical protein